MSERPQFFIYGLVDPRNGLIRYVGQSSRGYDRPEEHIKPGFVKIAPDEKKAWLEELIALSLSYEIIELEVLTSAEGLDEAEIRNIRDCKIMNYPLLNVTDGGNSGRPAGWHHTPEAKAKLSAVHSGKKLSQWHIQRIIESNTGLVRSQETRDKVSLAHRGKSRPNGSLVLKQWYIDNPDNSERNQKMAQTSAHPVIDESGNTYSSAKDVARKTGINKATVHKNLRMNEIGLPVKMIDKHSKAFAYTEEMPDHVARKGKPVIVSDGREFPSLKETAKAVGIVYEVVQRNIRLNPDGLPLILLKKSGLGFAYVSGKPTKSKSTKVA